MFSKNKEILAFRDFVRWYNQSLSDKPNEVVMNVMFLYKLGA